MRYLENSTARERDKSKQNLTITSARRNFKIRYFENSTAKQTDKSKENLMIISARG